MLHYVLILSSIKAISITSVQRINSSISQSHANLSVDTFLVSPHNLTFLTENARYFRMEAEFSRKGNSSNVFRHGLKYGYLS